MSSFVPSLGSDLVPHPPRTARLALGEPLTLPPATCPHLPLCLPLFRPKSHPALPPSLSSYCPRTALVLPSDCPRTALGQSLYCPTAPCSLAALPCLVPPVLPVQSTQSCLPLVDVRPTSHPCCPPPPPDSLRNVPFPCPRTVPSSTLIHMSPRRAQTTIVREGALIHLARTQNRNVDLIKRTAVSQALLPHSAALPMYPSPACAFSRRRLSLVDVGPIAASAAAPIGGAAVQSHRCCHTCHTSASEHARASAMGGRLRPLGLRATRIKLHIQSSGAGTLV